MTSIYAQLRQKHVAILLALLIGWYALATLPYLGDFPLVDWAQPMIAAPAYKLATQGIYGSDMFTGFYRSELRNYDHMPMYPLLVSLSFKVQGLGVWQARLVSVLSGLAAVLLTFYLGRQLYDTSVGFVAAAALCAVRLGLPNFNDVLRLGYQMNASGIPLLDFARVIRFDVLVPVWVVAACLCFYWAHRHDSRLGYLGAGVLAGLATLTHLYGAFILAVLITLLLWQSGWRVLRSASIYLVLLGWLLALLPYLVYVMQDFDAYRGQLLRHEARFDLLNPGFYWNSLVREPWRYVSWLGGTFQAPVLWPRVGIWLMAVSLVAANVILLRRVRRASHLSDQMLLISLPILAGLLALLINIKRYPYLALILPFLALQMAFAIVYVWRRATATRTTRLARLALRGVLLAALIEGGIGVLISFQMARLTTPYQRMGEAVRHVIPTNARIVASHVLWFELADYDVRSANLVFVLSDPHYRIPQTPVMDEVLHEIDPDYVIMENRLLQAYRREPEAFPSAQIVMQWRMFDEYIQRQCGTVVMTILAPDYGDITVYRCEQS